VIFLKDMKQVPVYLEERLLSLIPRVNMGLAPTPMLTSFCDNNYRVLLFKIIDGISAENLNRAKY